MEEEQRVRSRLKSLSGIFVLTVEDEQIVIAYLRNTEFRKLRKFLSNKQLTKP